MSLGAAPIDFSACPPENREPLPAKGCRHECPRHPGFYFPPNLDCIS